MVVDPYGDARQLKRHLEAQGFTDWAAKLEDILAGGSTGTEILMGLRWLMGKLPTASLTDETRKLIKQIELATDALLR